MDPLDGLSTDPAVLAGQLVERSQPAGASPIPPPTSGPNVAASTAQVASVIDVLLERANATPELKAALSQVLAGLEGVTVNSATLDPVGRPAWSVAFDNHAVTKIWWFDPKSDQLLVGRVHSKAGRFTFFTVYEASGVVSSIQATDAVPSFIPPTTVTIGRLGEAAQQHSYEGTGSGMAPSITVEPSGMLTPIDAARLRGRVEYRLM